MAYLRTWLVVIPNNSYKNLLVIYDTLIKIPITSGVSHFLGSTVVIMFRQAGDQTTFNINKMFFLA